MSRADIHERDEEEIQERVAPPGEVVHEAIAREGEHELRRTNRALAWSGLAAGLSMGFSFVAEALLRSRLPEAAWTPVVSKLGYSVGFVIVILGRQQLFTKNTLTVILPLLDRSMSTRLRNVARLWTVVLATNLAGALLFAAFLAQTDLFDSGMQATLTRLSTEMAPGSFWPTLLRSVVAGWLIALMIWLLPYAESARVWVIILIAYVVGLGEFPHIIAESVPAAYRVFTGQMGIAVFLGAFFVPVLLGNIVGGVALVAAGAHAEFQPDLQRRAEHKPGALASKKPMAEGGR